MDAPWNCFNTNLCGYESRPDRSMFLVCRQVFPCFTLVGVCMCMYA